MPDYTIEYLPELPEKTDYGIGAIGSGFIMRDVQLVAYENAGFNTVAIASRTPANAQAAADARGIETVYDTWQELLDDERVEILDIAYPPDQQLGIIREAVKRDHIKGILAQKPVAMNYEEAKEIVSLCEEAGKTLSVNQNMRYDQSMRALKSLIEQGAFGELVLGTIEMRAIPHWQTFLADYDRLTLLNMSIHHIDVMRFLFGDPERIYCSTRPDPRTEFDHTDGIALYIMEYDNGFRASAWDDVWTGPVNEGAAGDIYIKWRVEGTDGMAHGTIGWPKYGDSDSQSTLSYTVKSDLPEWVTPAWPEVWFPDAFAGPMAQLMEAIQTGEEPELSGKDNLKTMALIEAAYKSAETHESVVVADMLT
jgi:predicted dehydrogenase